jgi:hypothetical protein
MLKPFAAVPICVAVSVPGIRALWKGAPWTLRVYVGLGVAGQLWRAVAHPNVYGAVTMLIVIGVIYLLLKGARLAWIAMVVLTSGYFVLFLLALWVVPVLIYLVHLGLLLAPPTRRHFARERSAPPGAEASRTSRLRASPLALKAFAVGLVVFAVVPLIVTNVDRLDEKPVRAVLTIAFSVVLWGSIGFFVTQGARVAWSISIALLCAMAAATIAAGIWPVAVVPIVLLLLLLLPGSVTFVWGDRRRVA